MSNKMRGTVMGRLSDWKTKEPNSSVARPLPTAHATDNELEEYVPDAPALAAETLGVSRAFSSSPASKKSYEADKPHSRAVWLLLSWLVVSVVTITVAGGVVARYF